MKKTLMATGFVFILLLGCAAAAQPVSTSLAPAGQELAKKTPSPQKKRGATPTPRYSTPTPTPQPAYSSWMIGMGETVVFVTENGGFLSVTPIELSTVGEVRNETPAPDGGKGWAFRNTVTSNMAIVENLACTFNSEGRLMDENCRGYLNADGSEWWPNGRQKTGLEDAGIFLTATPDGVVAIFDGKRWGVQR